MLERGCNFLPFDQPFLVSERLSRVALEKISDMIRNPVNPSHLRRGVRKEFENILSVAKDEIDLVSPWISPEVVDSLLKRSYEKHLRVRILTTADTTNKIQAQSLEKLVHATKENPRMFQVRTMEELHAKGMLVDNIILLYGSFNFTTSGLDVNIENVVLDFSINGTKKFQSTFEELWEKAKPLT
jgi:phosphatidylserine/phosphatidylglycerophosphate/cardiolipin synthase-like enzyme